MKKFILFLLSALAVNLTATSLPDCSHPSFDQERRLIVVKGSDRKSLQVIKILSALEHDLVLSSSLFPIFDQGNTIIHARFHRLYQSTSRKIIDNALTQILSQGRVTISCEIYQPQET